MSAQEEIPILITCGCETEVPILEAVSKSQSCFRSTCGYIPCGGDNCSPNYNNLSVDEKCYPQHYLKRTTTWQARPSSSSQSSSYTVRQNAELMLNILKILENEEIDNLLESNTEDGQGLTIENTYDDDNISILNTGGARVETSVCTVDPSCNCTTSNNGNEAYCSPGSTNACPSIQYTNPTPVTCDPKTMPDYPSFISCGSSGSPLQAGQNRSLSPRSYNFDVESINIVNKQLAQYRIVHFPVRTGYLKVWLRTKTSTSEWRACPPGSTTGGGSSGSGTNCGPNTCKTWHQISEAVIAPVKEYVWESDSYEEKDFSCEDKIISNVETLVAANGSDVTVEISKYSYVKNYTPDDPETKPYCNPNGFPIKNPGC
jgi:hypothetical protein